MSLGGGPTSTAANKRMLTGTHELKLLIPTILGRLLRVLKQIIA